VGSYFIQAASSWTCTLRRSFFAAQNPPSEKKFPRFERILSEMSLSDFAATQILPQPHETGYGDTLLNPLTGDSLWTVDGCYFD
jgi:hypothetical protein